MRTKDVTPRALVILLICSWAFAVHADQSKKPRHDPLDDIAGGFTIGDAVEVAGKAAAAFAMAQEAFAEFSREIEAARKAFWAQYPNGSKRAEAEAEFARKLWEKDVQYVILSRVDGRCVGGARPAHPNRLSAVLHAAGGEVDGGLAGGTAGDFCARLEAARGRDPVSATKLPEYARYQRARDWAELFRAGNVDFASPYDLLRPKEPQWYVMGLIWGHNEYGIKRDALTEGVFPDVLQRTKTTFDTLAKTHGRERVLGRQIRGS